MVPQAHHERTTLLICRRDYSLNGNLRHIREALALSRRELASRSDVNESTIYRAEHGMTTLRPSTIQKLARVLGVPATEITKSDASSDSRLG